MSGSAFAQALDQLGGAIVAGELPAGYSDTIEGLVARTGVSRSVVREVTRVLGALGMMSAGRRVGLRVLAGEHWDVLDPLVIRWRLDGPGRRQQIDELRAVRRVVEPVAAEAAARAVGEGIRDSRTLELAAAALRTAAGSADAEAFLRADRDFHAAVLVLSGNSMFARLRTVIDESLRDRSRRDPARFTPDAHDVRLHGRLADAIARGDGHAAAAAMSEIIDRTADDSG